MRKHPTWALVAIVATLGIVFCVASYARSQRDAPKATLSSLVAKKTKLDEADVAKVLEALGPIVRDKLASGETIEFPGIGQIRVVRIPEHKDMVKGRPGVIAATNNVELIPTDEVVKAANSPTAVPAVTVPVFEFNPLPDQTQGLKMPSSRIPTNRHALTVQFA